MPLVDPEGVDMTNSTFFAAALAPAAPHYFKVTGVDVLGREGTESEVASASAGVGVVRFAGSTRAGTAVAASAARYLAYPDDPYMGDTVVIASDSDYVQALAANSLAGSLNASVLLAGTTLPRDTAAEVRRLGAKKAYVVGTTRAVSTAVDAALKALGLHVERIKGTDAYDVAAKVARRVMSPAAVLPGDVEVIVVNGTSKSDMCSLMPVAYSSRLPIVILKGAAVPSQFKALLAKVEVSGGTVIGGKYAVSTKTARSVFSGGDYERVWGNTAVQTAGKLAGWAVEKGYSTWHNVGVANGANWGYNLAIGAATRGGVVLLNAGKTLDPTTAALLRKNAPNIQTVSVFGGTGTATASVFAKIRTAMSARSGPVALEMPFPPPFPDDGDM
jgi:lactocepin